MSDAIANASENLSPRTPSPGDRSPNGGSQRHDDPFQKFFEEKDHMHKDSPTSAFPVSSEKEEGALTFTPFEMAVVYALLATSTSPTVSIPRLLEQLSFYVKPMAGGADEEYVAKSSLLANALAAGGARDEEGDIKTAETAEILETNPSAFVGVQLYVGNTATPSALEYVLTNEKLSDDDHAAIAQQLIHLDTEKDGVFNLIIGFRELMRVVVPIMESKGEEDPNLAKEESREIVRRIFNTAHISAEAGYAISLSDFIEMYAMEVYVIPPEFRTVDTAALTRRIDLADYSLLWAAINNIRGIDANHIEAALTEAASVEGVVADECSLHAIIKTVTTFIEAASERDIGTDDALQQLADILVLNPTSLHIPVMPMEQRQEVAARKLLLYFKPSAVLSVLRALLLEDIRCDGILSKPMAEAALMVELSTSSHKQSEGNVNEASHNSGSGNTNPPVDEVVQYAGVDEDRVEEMIRNVLLSAGVSDTSQEVNLNHFIQTLIELTQVLPSRYCADVVVPFKGPHAVQLNELIHLRQLVGEAVAASGDALTNPMGCGCITEEALQSCIDAALVSQQDNAEAKEGLLMAFKAVAFNATELARADAVRGGAFSDSPKKSADGNGGKRDTPVLIDIVDALSVAMFTTDAVTFNIASLSDYHAASIVSRRVAKGNVRHIAKAFIILDSDRSKALTLDAFREVMRANPRFTSTEVLEGAFEAMDLDMDGALCLEEFISSFNNPNLICAALSNAQLSSLTNRRASVKELHQGPSIQQVEEKVAESARVAPLGTALAAADEEDVVETPTRFVAGAITTPSKAALVASLSSSPLSPARLAASASPNRRSTKALSPHNDASGVPVDDADLRVEFEQYDVNNNGFLDRRKFAKIYRGLENFGLEPSERDIEVLFNSVCGNRNIVTFDEFSLLMLRRSRM